MKLNRVVVRGALSAMITCVVLVAGCASGRAVDDDADMLPSTIGAAARGTAGEGVEEDEGSSEEGSAGDGESETDMDDGHAAAEPSFGEVYDVLAASCGGGQSGCHIDGMSAGLIMPDAATAYAALVGVASSKCAGELLVAPGAADESVLVTVLEGGADCVKAMPLGRDPLGENTIAMIRRWIDAGASED